MLGLKGVGETVIQRLEQAGFSSLSQLSSVRAEEVTWQISQMLSASCWHNSPQARKAIQAIIALAKQQVD